MPGLRDFLDRFRSAGPPGPAAPPAVPADHRSRQLAEVAPVFAALAPTVEQARDMVAAGAAEADRIRIDALREEQAILRAAEEDRPALYARAFAEARAAAKARGEERIATAGVEAERIARQAAARIPALADTATLQVRGALEPARAVGVP
ncbi:hypothetical protein ODJ79_37390 [Actinoplanes sp. KI2]|uniref:hypothetical protein n=1 Tax=Actinoplanes sp. KI2 TaxID=2983315 RepID=UPI0021D59AC6|nr:hypothetical protein [Actinoplanes sp. KI2]MCU7729423.1 hypothetical protein [Actinoplanes sp. KI2]